MKNTDFYWFNHQNIGIEAAKDVDQPAKCFSKFGDVCGFQNVEKSWTRVRLRDCFFLSANNEVSTNLTSILPSMGIIQLIA